MKHQLILLFLCLPFYFLLGQDSANENSQVRTCAYHKHYQDFGNRVLDTLMQEGRILDPIEGSANFGRANFGFYTNGDRLYKKARAIEPCAGKLIQVEYDQDFTEEIDLASYRERGNHFFATRGKV